jgi:hypothetical protein
MQRLQALEQAREQATSSLMEELTALEMNGAKAPEVTQL